MQEEDLDIKVSDCGCNYRCNCNELFQKCIDTLNNGSIKGGAHSGKKKSRKSSKKLDEENISHNILSELFTDTKKFKNIMTRIDNQDTSIFVKDYIRKHLMNTSQFATEDEIDQIKKRIFDNIKLFYTKQCKDKLPILGVMDNNVGKLIREKINISKYENAIDRSIIQSNNFLNLEKRDLMNYCNILNNNKITFGNRNSLANPVLVALFGHKLPILENLAIRNDTLELVESLYKISKRSDKLSSLDIEDRISFNNNETLFKFRLSDPNLLSQSKDNSIVDSELKRSLIHCLLRMAIIDLRDGKFNSEYNNLLNENISALNINYPGYTKTPSGYLDTIFRLFSFKPTSLLKNNVLENGFTETKVPYYNYNIDSINNIVSDSLNFNRPNLMSGQLLKDLIQANLLKNIYKNNASNEIKCSMLSNQQNVNVNDSVLDSIGIFVISVNRFANNPLGLVMDNRNIMTKDTLTIGNKVFKLRSAVLSTQYNKNICGRNKINNKYYNYTLLKLDNNKWFEYAPFKLQDDNELNKLKCDEVKNGINNILCLENKPLINNQSEIENFICQASNKFETMKYIKDLSDNVQNSFSIDNFLVDDIEAFRDINTNGVLLIYSIDLDTPGICMNPCNNNSVF